MTPSQQTARAIDAHSINCTQRVNGPNAASLALALVCVVASGCTTLGPMPATTGLSAVPVQRPDVELQAAAVPGYFLSSAVQEEAAGAAIGQLALMLEPGKLIRAPGLALGGRYVGNQGGDGYLEPMLRYRLALDGDDRFSAAAIGFGTHARGESDGASYSATRAGLELGLNARLTPPNHWAELHASLGAAATALAVDGEYCLNSEQRFGVDCSASTRAPVRAEAGGLYPSATATLALDFGRHLRGPLHGGRLGVLGSVGSMPRVESGTQSAPSTYAAAGLSLSVGLGASE